ncbi:hypothetical protein AAG614_15270 [Citromicrobium bathyomarinum]
MKNAILTLAALATAAVSTPANAETATVSGSGYPRDTVCSDLRGKANARYSSTRWKITDYGQCTCEPRELINGQRLWDCTITVTYIRRR